MGVWAAQISATSVDDQEREQALAPCAKLPLHQKIVKQMDKGMDDRASAPNANNAPQSQGRRNSVRHGQHRGTSRFLSRALSQISVVFRYPSDRPPEWSGSPPGVHMVQMVRHVFSLHRTVRSSARDLYAVDAQGRSIATTLRCPADWPPYHDKVHTDEIRTRTQLHHVSSCFKSSMTGETYSR